MEMEKNILKVARNLTRKQNQVLNYFFDNCDENGYLFASYRKIAHALNVSLRTVATAIKRLIELGILEKKARGVYKVHLLEGR